MDKNLAESFASFTAELHEGSKPGEGRIPYAWQTELLKKVKADGKWPESLCAPTSFGKTSVIDIHIFLNAMAGARRFDVPSTLPRRLVMTINRRALVDKQFEYAVKLIDRLRKKAQEDPQSTAAAVLDGLRNRAGQPAEAEPSEYLDAFKIRGGDDSRSYEWRRKPLATQIACMTPDMFGSRLLFRGYGATRYARPLEAGLLAYDTVVVLDEAHLNQQLLKTAQQIPRLEQLRSAEKWEGGPQPLHVIASTATPVEKSDVFPDAKTFEEDEQLNARYCKSKPLLNPPFINVEKETRLEQIAAQCQHFHELVNGTVGCIMNTVSDAIAVAEILGDTGVVCVVGPMRPWDRSVIERKYPGIFTPEGNENVDYLVSTQTLEVGNDIDFAALVTEMAPAESLVQRAGRLDRFGKRSNTKPVMAIFDSKKPDPYKESDLEETRKWLDGLPEDEGLCLSTIGKGNHRPPKATLDRLLLERLEYGDADYLRITSEDCAPESTVLTGNASGIELWLRDSLSGDTQISVCVRELPNDDDDAKSVIGLVPPVPDEILSVSPLVLKTALTKAKERNDREGDGEPFRFFSKCTGDGKVTVEDDPESVWFTPDKIIVVDSEMKLFVRGVVWGYETETSEPDVIDDVYMAVAFEKPERKLPLILHIPAQGDPSELTDDAREACEKIAAAVLGHQKPKSDEWQRLNDCLKEGELDRCIPGDENAYEPSGIDEEDLDFVRVFGDSDDLDSGFWIVAVPFSRLRFDWYGEVTGAGATCEPVTLDEHRTAVANTVRTFAEALKLPAVIRNTLEQSGLYHDEGKRADHFQEMLYGRQREQDEDILAKGSKPKIDEKGPNTRHEQLSAAIAYEKLEQTEEYDRNLAVRLVGTSHGRGRNLFDDNADKLFSELGAKETEGVIQNAQDLFNKGVWEWIVDSTTSKYGIWGSAYLEALVRAADMSVSAGKGAEQADSAEGTQDDN